LTGKRAVNGNGRADLELEKLFRGRRFVVVG
jgi:hypothetical protein